MANQQTMSFTHRGETYTLKDFFDEYQHCLPKLIIVSQGYYGGVDIETFCTGQILRVHKYTKQKRVIAKDASNRDISIPLDYPLKFRLIETSQKAVFHGLKMKTGKGSKELSLKEIITSEKLPVQVELALPPDYRFEVGNRHERASSFGVITLTGEYDETYLLANTIHEGHLVSTVSLMPLYLKDVLVSTVTGIQGQTADQFSRFTEDLAYSSQNIIYNMRAGNADIALYSPLSVQSSNEYDYIAPVELFRFSKLLKPRKSIDDIDETRTKTVSDLKEALTSRSKPPAVPKRLPLEPKQQAASSKDDSKEHKYVNDVGRAIVQPFDVHTETEPECEDKPIEKLTINELGLKLKALKLEKYVKQFSNEGIDGSLLVELNEDILKENFKFSTIESIKLMKFARTGHIPH